MVTKTTVVLMRDHADEDSDFLVAKAHISAGDCDHQEWYKPASSNTTSPADLATGPM